MISPRCSLCEDGCEVCNGTGVWQPYNPCPCACGQVYSKLTKKGHVVGCKCRSCIGRRSKRKGQRGQAFAHRALGGTGFTPGNEESAPTYDLQVQVEVKAGKQIPANLRKGLESEWFRSALKQAQDARSPGAEPGVFVVVGGKGFLIVEYGKDANHTDDSE